ncbi:hypothetical protein GH714_040756 [Hevea brasiliensis]|uniref:Pentatricopeptide repeat-containing protein n=1 Tax=Hevea brasiliensis TaxID=3981 RepID=A0A6A6MQA8_HEVBR|nr:hypothetical protein GH714_040756 [Hevea brasiliensis]
MYSKPASTLTLSLLENYSAAQWYSPIHWTMLAASFATLQSQMSSCITPSFEALPKRVLESGNSIALPSIDHGLTAHLFVGTTLVSMVGNVKGAREMFDLMPFRDLTSWNVMLAGHVKEGELELARKMFMEMPVKDDVSWSTIIVGFAHNGYFDEAFGFFRKLQRDGTRPNEVSLTGVLSACAQAGAFEFGKILHGFIEKAGLIWIISVNNALLDAYSKCGNLSMARLVFERMPEKKSIVSWTSMMVGLAMHGHGEEAIRLFHEMERSETRPDGITFISLLYACSHAGLIEQGCEYLIR